MKENRMSLILVPDFGAVIPKDGFLGAGLEVEASFTAAPYFDQTKSELYLTVMGTMTAYVALNFDRRAVELGLGDAAVSISASYENIEGKKRSFSMESFESASNEAEEAEEEVDVDAMGRQELVDLIERRGLRIDPDKYPKTPSLRVAIASALEPDAEPESEETPTTDAEDQVPVYTMKHGVSIFTTDESKAVAVPVSQSSYFRLLLKLLGGPESKDGAQILKAVSVYGDLLKKLHSFESKVDFTQESEENPLAEDFDLSDVSLTQKTEAHSALVESNQKEAQEVRAKLEMVGSKLSKWFSQLARVTIVIPGGDFEPDEGIGALVIAPFFDGGNEVVVASEHEVPGDYETASDYEYWNRPSTWTRVFSNLIEDVIRDKVIEVVS